MNDEIIKLLAERYFNNERASDWAIKCLEKGHDSRSLRMLASMSDSFTSPFELDEYYQRSLKELGWDKVNYEEYLMRYAKILAEEIVEDKTDPIQTSQNIYSILIDLEYSSELSAWFDINEMIWDYNYFLKTGKDDSYWFRPKEKLISIIKKASKELLNSK